MSKYIKHIACLKCDSSDGLALYLKENGDLDGYCWVCETWFSPSEIESEQAYDRESIGTSRPTDEAYTKYMMAQIKELTTKALPDRKLERKYLNYYGVKMDGPLIYYPYYKDGKLSGYKKKDTRDKKAQRSIGDNKQVDFFGSQLIKTGKKTLLIITEGEEDAIAAFQMLHKAGKNYRVVSLPYGAKIKSIQHLISKLEDFENIILAFDMDEIGQSGAMALRNVLTKADVKIAEYSEKDANDMLKAGKEKEFLSSIFNAKKPDLGGIITIEDIWDEVAKPVVEGLSYPWKGLTAVTYGYRPTELIGLGGGTGSGKTEIFKEFIVHNAFEHQRPTGIFFLEEPVKKTFRVLAGKLKNLKFHLPGGDWSQGDLLDAMEMLKKRLYLYDEGRKKDLQDSGASAWEKVENRIRYMHEFYGVNEFYLDHLTALVAQEDNEYKALNSIMAKYAALLDELKITAFYISHLRKAIGTPHEEGGRVRITEFKGSGAISFWSHFLFGNERNQQAEDPVEKNTTTLRGLKDRETGLATGCTFKLFYDHETGRMVETGNDEEFNVEDLEEETEEEIV